MTAEYYAGPSNLAIRGTKPQGHSALVDDIPGVIPTLPRSDAILINEEIDTVGGCLLSTIKRHWRDEIAAVFAVASFCGVIFTLLSPSFNSVEVCIAALILGFLYSLTRML
jgi:hypothetical protein